MEWCWRSSRETQFNSIAQREHFITWQDIRNISKSVVDMSTVNRADDAQSVVAIVKKLAMSNITLSCCTNHLA